MSKNIKAIQAVKNAEAAYFAARDNSKKASKLAGAIFLEIQKQGAFNPEKTLQLQVGSPGKKTYVYDVNASGIREALKAAASAEKVAHAEADAAEAIYRVSVEALLHHSRLPLPLLLNWMRYSFSCWKRQRAVEASPA